MGHIELQFRFVQDIFLECLFYAKHCAYASQLKKSDEDIIHGWERLMVSVGFQDMWTW